MSIINAVLPIRQYDKMTAQYKQGGTSRAIVHIHIASKLYKFWIVISYKFTILLRQRFTLLKYI
jgi:hypothetical protein